MNNIIITLRNYLLFGNQERKDELHRLKLQRSIQRHWPGDPISLELLVRESWESLSDTDPLQRKYEYIVFVNSELNIDWITGSQKYDQFAANICHATALESIPHKHLNKSQILAFKNLIGEAIVAYLENNKQEAEALIAEARQYINDRIAECSRKWILEFSSLLIFPLCIVGFMVTYWDCTFWSNDKNLWFGACFWGGIGSYLSIIRNAGKENLDSAAGAWLHFLQIVSKIISGGLFGIISYFILKNSSLCPPMFDSLNESYLGYNLFGFIAGFLEYFIPNIVATQVQEKR